MVGSNEGAPKADLPAGLTTVTRHLKASYSFSNYRLANHFSDAYQHGNIEYKSVSNILGQESDSESQTFLDWSMSNFRTVQAVPSASISFRSSRAGQDGPAGALPRSKL